MANKQQGKVEITLDKPRTLRFTLNALAEIEDKLNVPLSKLGEVELGVKTVRTFLWAALIHEDPEITEAEVGNMVDFENLKEVQSAITTAFKAANRKN